MTLLLLRNILMFLEEAMPLEHFDNNRLSAEALGMGIPLWGRVMKLLVDNDMITGVEIDNEGSYPKAQLYYPEITLKGLEYLHR